MKLKYIVIQRPSFIEEIIVFSDTFNHDDIASDMIKDLEAKIISAGFVSFNAELPNNRISPIVYASCYGQSTSLCLNSREKEDSDLLNLYLNNTRKE